MKLITIYLDKRVDYVLDFDSEERQHNDTIIVSAESDKSLFTLYNHTGIVNGLSDPRCESNEGCFILQDTCKKEVYIDRFECLDSEESNLDAKEIFVYFTTERPKLVCKPDETKLYYRYELDHTDIGFVNFNLPKNPVMVVVHFILDKSKEITLNLCLTPSKRIKDVVLDFGSEASQMAIFDRNSEQRVGGITYLFDDMSKLMSDNKDSDIDDEILQEEQDNKKLFKSVFFSKVKFNHIEGSHVPVITRNGTMKPNECLRMLTSGNQAHEMTRDNSHIQIPNVKIYSYGGIETPRINDIEISRYKEGYFYRATLNAFLLNAMIQAVKGEDNPICVSLHLLMPNVYSQDDVNVRLRWVRKDLDCILNNNNCLKLIKAVEVTMVSESDASLFGTLEILRDRSEIEDGQYLVIDAGKGTLDFSIIEHESNETDMKFRSKFRSGIIGSGNALSYAYLVALICDFLKVAYKGEWTDADIKKVLYHVVLGNPIEGRSEFHNDTVPIMRLMRAVENYKCLIGDKQSFFSDDNEINNKKKRFLNEQTVDSWREIKIDKLTEFISNMIDEDHKPIPLSANAYQYVDAMIEALSDEICDHLDYCKARGFNKINFIVFAGRAFELTIFKQKVYEKIKKIFNNQELKDVSDIEGNNASMKTVCLFLRNIIKNGFYNGMICYPFVKGYGKDKSDFQKDINLKSLIEYINLKGIMNRINSENRYTFTGNNARVLYMAGQNEGNVLVNGFDVPIKHVKDTLLIGGKAYFVNHIGNKHCDSTLFYTNECMYVRTSDNKVEKLKNDGVDVRISKFLMPSVFPDIMLNDFTECILPNEYKTRVLKTSGNSVNSVEQENTSSCGDDKLPPVKNKITLAPELKELEDLNDQI